MKKLKLNAEWKLDCGSKQDYDGHIVSISTRYYPDHTAYPSLLLWYGDDDYITLAEAEFKAKTEGAVKARAEKWAQQQMDRIVSILLKEYNPNIKDIYP